VAAAVWWGVAAPALAKWYEYKDIVV
jgi:hypothetical protein